jgi:hypothetical protein
MLEQHAQQSAIQNLQSKMLLHPPALEQLSLALAAFVRNDSIAALAAAQDAAAAAPTSRLAREAVRYLERVCTAGQASVYVSGEAFGVFIRGGGNLPLYAALSAALSAIYAGAGPLTLLDVGVGDGMALLPALTPELRRIDLVEPSAPMLGRTTSALAARGVAFRAFAMPFERFAARTNAHWELAQATFSLQSLAPDARRAALAWLRAHSDRLLIAEFDVPELGDGPTPARVAHMAARYERGLAEYDADDGLVAQGFLMPIFFSAFDPSAARTNYEQPIAAWEAELRAAGFATVACQRLYDYWWAPAYLLNAS